MRQVESASDFGAIIRKRRHERNVTQGALAARLGMSVSNLSRIEHGADLRVSTLLDIARELKLEPILVPKELVPSVRGILSTTDADHDAERGRFA
ncbi:MAG TPA: helix-turn-helix transcriptional regulator [Candidatus Elarobacter sp.]|jgi:transcriptional regulator with XRE-family HTH domain